MRDFDKTKAVARAAAEAAEHEEAGRLFGLVARASKAGNRADDEPATDKQLGLVSFKAGLSHNGAGE
jgi:hypothetical protein